MIQDNKIFDLINKEHKRQTVGIDLIASENFVSKNSALFYKIPFNKKKLIYILLLNFAQ